MSSINRFDIKDINKRNKAFSSFKVMIETAFYSNHVKPIESVKEAYELSLTSPGVIVTDLPIFQPEKLGLPSNAKILVENSGSVVGRTASARRILTPDNKYSTLYSKILKDSLFQATRKTFSVVNLL